jgi:hypothetical protein
MVSIVLMGRARVIGLREAYPVNSGWSFTLFRAFGAVCDRQRKPEDIVGDPLLTRISSTLSGLQIVREAHCGRHLIQRDKPRLRRFGALLIPFMLTSACAGGAALQPDKSIFSLDNNYQRFSYLMPIEETFDRTVSVFKEAGYKLDVVDRATGQISGRRGATGDKGVSSDKGLKFYALVLPKGADSELGIKVVQIIKSGTLVTSNAELILNDSQMYQYTFQRIQNINAQETLSLPQPDVSLGW